MFNSFRPMMAIGGIIAFAALGFALVLQYAFGLEPCPMCVFQRVAMVAVGLIMLAAALHGPSGRLGQGIYAGLAALAAGSGIAIAGCAYSYLQDYLPHVTQYLVREGWVDVVGLGRMVLSYPDMLPDAMANGALASRKICRTFSDCTTGPRNGLISGCFPLDDYYKSRPEFDQLKQIKKTI